MGLEWHGKEWGRMKGIGRWHSLWKLWATLVAFLFAFLKCFFTHSSPNYSFFNVMAKRLCCESLSGGDRVWAGYAVLAINNLISTGLFLVRAATTEQRRVASHRRLLILVTLATLTITRDTGRFWWELNRFPKKNDFEIDIGNLKEDPGQYLNGQLNGTMKLLFHPWHCCYFPLWWKWHPFYNLKRATPQSFHLIAP